MNFNLETAVAVAGLIVALGTVAAAIFKAGVQLGGIKDQLRKLSEQLSQQAQENRDEHRHLHGRIDDLSQRTAMLEARHEPACEH